MKRWMRLFLTGFVITGILIMTLCGFAVIDLSTEYYMPGSFEPMLQLNRLDADGLELAWMGGRYTVSAAPYETLTTIAENVSYLLPPETVWLSQLAQNGYERAQEVREERRWTEFDN